MMAVSGDSDDGHKWVRGIRGNNQIQKSQVSYNAKTPLQKESGVLIEKI
jgi:hypothetical protein